ncbi:hypothetical protein DH2020_040972 [Rehmannia glutinosa]|uniref:Reverse transcriptase domain-containing protein n=1 Tax=Rehmannia glutinosa TaxID=99300 RepID=A0ABR0USQ5_REHGL
MKQSNLWDKSAYQIMEVEKNVEKLATQEEIFWRQRSRNNWLKHGDRNTPYFHAQASQRRAKNWIKELASTQGDFCTRQEEMVDIITEYFHDIFMTQNPSTEAIEEIAKCVECKVNEEMNEILCKPFTAREVRKALFDIQLDKAPGPDGMPSLFYQKYWSVVGEAVTAEVLNVLNNGGDLKDWNGATITLIPKVANPVMVKEFRPVSLCNVCYKIVARAITNRMRPLMQDIMDEHQSAFIPGRLITDNVILGLESIHWIHNHKGSNRGYASLKLDMSKAYDRVEWGFLRAVMDRMGFAAKWIELIMKCVQTVHYAFVVNQEVVGHVKPTRGLRQGDHEMCTNSTLNG